MIGLLPIPQERCVSSDMRSGVGAARALLQSNDSERYREALRRYSDAVALVSEGKKKAGELVELDHWLWNIYPQEIQRRGSPKSITKEELRRVMTWKLLRGKNRPTLLSLIQQNNETFVETVTTKAMEFLENGDWYEALNKLTELRGVGPGLYSPHLHRLIFFIDLHHLLLSVFSSNSFCNSISTLSKGDSFHG